MLLLLEHLDHLHFPLLPTVRGRSTSSSPLEQLLSAFHATPYLRPKVSETHARASLALLLLPLLPRPAHTHPSQRRNSTPVSLATRPAHAPHAPRQPASQARPGRRAILTTITTTTTDRPTLFPPTHALLSLPPPSSRVHHSPGSRSGRQAIVGTQSRSPRLSSSRQPHDLRARNPPLLTLRHVPSTPNPLPFFFCFYFAILPLAPL